MKKFFFLIVVVAAVVAALAGGTAFLLRYNEISDLKRLAAQAEDKMNSGHIDAAIDMLRKAEAGNPSGETKLLLGKAYFQLGKVGQAMEYFQTVVDGYAGTDEEAVSLLYLARNELENKNIDEATRRALEIVTRHRDSDSYDHALVLLSKISLAAGDKKRARENLSLVLKKPESPARSDAEFLVGDLNMEALKSPDAAPEDEIYVLKSGDTLYELERKFKVSQDLLMGINNITNPAALSIGKRLRIPKLDITVTVDKVNRTLTLRNDKEFLKKYRVAINRDDSAVPEGKYSISSKEPKGREYSAPGGENIKRGEAGNPYGTRYLELQRNVGIHGTDSPEKIGQLISVGSISMKNEDIEEVYALVNSKPGTPVTIRGKASDSSASSSR